MYFLNGNAAHSDLNGHRNGHAHWSSQQVDEIGDQHIGTSTETPMRKDAHLMSNEEKVAKIQEHFHHIMDILGLDLSDDSLQGTPQRVARMYVEEVFAGLNPANKPDVRLFENTYGYDEMLVEKDISVYSYCEHHFVPIVGRAHVAYIPGSKVIGLSKINRLVKYYARRPQVQERLTLQIANEFRGLLQTEDVAVVIDAHHMCVSSRGIEDTQSSTVTSKYFGRFQESQTRQEFLRYLGGMKRVDG